MTILDPKQLVAVTGGADKCPDPPKAECHGLVNLCNNRIQVGPVDVPNPFIKNQEPT